MKDNFCNLCNSNNSYLFLNSFDKHGKSILNKNKKFKLNYCKNCGNIYLTNIKINKNYYRKYYSQNYYSNKNKYFSKLTETILSNFSINLKEKFILKYFNKKYRPLKILDIGCGEGGFLKHLSPDKFEKCGIEINVQGYKKCLKCGINVINKDILKIKKMPHKFDVITMWHVLEHLPNTKNIFQFIKNNLNKNGIFVFSVPNSNSLGFKFGKHNWFHLDTPRHLFIPNSDNLNFLLKKYRFKIIKIKYEFYDYPLDLFWSFNKYLRYLILPIYPILKIYSQETITFICKHK